MRQFISNGKSERTSRILRMDSALDFSALLRRCLGNEPLACRIVHTFSDRLQDDVNKLEQAMENRDMLAMAALAHRIKGTAANVAADRIRLLADSMEEQARQHDLDKLRHSLDQFRVETVQIVNWVGRRITRVDHGCSETK